MRARPLDEWRKGESAEMPPRRGPSYNECTADAFIASGLECSDQRTSKIAELGTDVGCIQPRTVMLFVQGQAEAHH